MYIFVVFVGIWMLVLVLKFFVNNIENVGDLFLNLLEILLVKKFIIFIF